MTRRGVPLKEEPESCDCRFTEGGCSGGRGWDGTGCNWVGEDGGGLDGGTMSSVVLGLSVWWWYKDVMEIFSSFFL